MWYQKMAAALPVLGKVIDAFRSGGGVAQSEYGPDLWAGMERFTGGWFDHLLVPVWLPALPAVAKRLEINCADDPADNAGPLAATFYGFSLFYCMTTSLAHGGAGLGTCGMPEATVRELAAAAGFGEVSRAPVDNPFNVIYELRP